MIRERKDIEAKYKWDLSVIYKDEAAFNADYALTEEKIKEETKATIRCIPVDSAVCEEEGKCIYTGKPSSRRVLFAISY